MRDLLLVRFGEVHLKGLNRPYFLKMLVRDIKKALAQDGIGGHVWMSEERMYVSDFTDMDQCAECVRKVFGVYSVSPAVEMEKDLEAVVAKAAEMMQGVKGSFKVFCRRSDKRFPIQMTMAALSSHFLKILRYHALLAAGVPRAEILSQLGINPYFGS